MVSSLHSYFYHQVAQHNFGGGRKPFLQPTVVTRASWVVVVAVAEFPKKRFRCSLRSEAGLLLTRLDQRLVSIAPFVDVGYSLRRVSMPE